MSTVIAAIILSCTGGIASIQTATLQHNPALIITEPAQDFSLLDDAGDHVLNFGAEKHGRRLDTTSKIFLKFKAFGSSFEYHLRRSPSMFTSDTAIYTYDKEDGTYLKFDAPEEARSFSSEAHDAGLTFLAHNRITGTVLLHNRSIEFHNDGLDNLVVHKDLNHGVMCGVGPNNIGAHDQHPLTNLRGAGAEDESPVAPRRQLQLVKWFGSSSCYSRDEITRRFTVGIAVGSNMMKRQFKTDLEAANYVVGVFNQANLVFRKQLNLVVSIGAIVLANSNKRIATNGQRVSGVSGITWDNTLDTCDRDLSTTLSNLARWEPPEQFGAWHVFDDCFWAAKTRSIGLANIGSICKPKGYYSNIPGYANTGANWFSKTMWKTFAHELGHNFGARHSFEEGQGSTGGIMDYSDGKLNGVFQFNTKYRKSEVCLVINKAITSGKCDHGFKTFQAACGNGLLEDGESCECNTGVSSCRFCNQCQLQAGKDCTPDAVDAACCTSTGQFADTSVLCKLGSYTGTCGGSKGECLLSPYQNYGLGEVCGIHSSSAPCKLSFKQSAGAACDTRKYTTCGSNPRKYCNAVEKGALCTVNGKRATCVERTGRDEMACTGPLLQSSVDCQGGWGDWSTCSRVGSCPTTTGSQTRTFKVTVARVGSGKACSAAAGATGSKACTWNKCPADCEAKWEDKTACSAKCGDASRAQTLKVTSPARNDGRTCTAKYGVEAGGLRQTKCTGLPACVVIPVVNCQGDYGAFGSCVANVGVCGAGKKTQVYKVTSKESGGGKSCGINPDRLQSCDIPCKVDCAGKWVVSAKCSKLCGPNSVKTKTYKVETPAKNGGKNCPFRDQETGTDSCPLKTCAAAEKLGDCGLFQDKTYLGEADVGGGSPVTEQWTVDKCYSVCKAKQACVSFSYTPEYGVCKLWSAGKTKDTRVSSIAGVTGTNLYRECKATFAASRTCGDHWPEKAFAGSGALQQYTNKNRQACNQACDANVACYAWSFDKSNDKCQLWPKVFAKEMQSKSTRSVNSDVYICSARTAEIPTTTTTTPKTTTTKPTTKPRATTKPKGPTTKPTTAKPTTPTTTTTKPTTTTPTTTLNPSCDCDKEGKQTGKPGCQKHNGRSFSWCYMSLGCDMRKWRTENDAASFHGGISNTYSMRWRQCTPDKEDKTEKDESWCSTTELQGRYKRNNGVCDAYLNIAVCKWDGGDCCVKGGKQPEMSLCKNDPRQCACIDPAAGGKGDKAKFGCQNKDACNHDQNANTGTDALFCQFPPTGRSCRGACIDDAICGGKFTEYKGCCRNAQRQAMGEFTDAIATTRGQCRTACLKDKLCTGFEWQQGLQKCRTFHTEVPIYGETACAGGSNVQCFINLNPVQTKKCVTGPDNTVDRVGQDCSEYGRHPKYCGFYDTITFNSTKCCACKAFECSNVDNPSKKDKFGKGCGDYAKKPKQYCGLPFRDSATFSYTDCCACQPEFLANFRVVVDDGGDSNKGLSTQALAGIITGSALGVVLIVGVVVAVSVVKKGKPNKGSDSSQPRQDRYSSSPNPHMDKSTKTKGKRLEGNALIDEIVTIE